MAVAMPRYSNLRYWAPAFAGEAGMGRQADNLSKRDRYRRERLR